MSFDQSVTQTTEYDAIKSSVLQAFVLRPIFRTAFLLCDVEGLTPAEAASRLGISPAAVRARLERARRLLNVRMREAIP